MGVAEMRYLRVIYPDHGNPARGSAPGAAGCLMMEVAAAHDADRRLTLQRDLCWDSACVQVHARRYSWTVQRHARKEPSSDDGRVARQRPGLVDAARPARSPR